MTPPKLKTGLWVAALVRTHDVAGISARVVRRGEADSGAVLLKLNRFEQGCAMLSQMRDAEGEAIWYHVLGPEARTEAACDAYAVKAAARDRDLWIVEIEDRQGRQLFPGRVV